MSDEAAVKEPWGFVVTATLHIPMLGNMERTICWDNRVAAIADAKREKWRDPGYRFDADEPPIYGRAEGRPVCQKCIKAVRRERERLAEELATAEAWNVARILGPEAVT